MGISSESSVMKKEKKLVIDDLWTLLDKRHSKRPAKGQNINLQKQFYPCKACQEKKKRC